MNHTTRALAALALAGALVTLASPAQAADASTPKAPRAAAQTTTPEVTLLQQVGVLLGTSGRAVTDAGGKVVTAAGTFVENSPEALRNTVRNLLRGDLVDQTATPVLKRGLR
ncbi:hypothetical protein [Streptomyces sp. NPDC089799]|uniref:hypothetical protein n=1 Tax=Streptomyces sp. NPDC089799 TaxID=3155066 RepID=UPI00344831D6